MLRKVLRRVHAHNYADSIDYLLSCGHIAKGLRKRVNGKLVDPGKIDCKQCGGTR